MQGTGGAHTLLKASMGLDGSVALFRGVQGGIEIANGDNREAAAHIGEATLLLLGIGVSKYLDVPGVHGVDDVVEFVGPRGALGRGSTANLSRGTTLPRNLREQLAVEEVISRPTMGTQLRRITMTDRRWPASDGWVKMQQIVQSSGREGPINVHYVYNTITRQIDDLKIVLPGAR